MERKDLGLKAVAQKRHTWLLLMFSAELHHMATPAAGEARKYNAVGPLKMMKLLSIEEFAESAVIPDSFSAFPSCNFMVTPGRKC